MKIEEARSIGDMITEIDYLETLIDDIYDFESEYKNKDSRCISFMHGNYIGVKIDSLDTYLLIRDSVLTSLLNKRDQIKKEIEKIKINKTDELRNTNTKKGA